MGVRLPPSGGTWGNSIVVGAFPETISEALTACIQNSDISRNAVPTRRGIRCSGIETSVIYISIG